MKMTYYGDREDYWINNFDFVQGMLSDAELYVYETEGKIEALVGIEDGFIAGIFVSNEMQSHGVGKRLLDKAKELNSNFSLSIYKKNQKAICFYQRERFPVKQEKMDQNAGEAEYLMTWNKEQSNLMK